MLKNALLLPFFLLSFPILGQNPENLTGTWTELIGQNRISENWSIPTTVILQHYEVLDEFQFIILRSGITYKSPENISVSAGYDYFYSESFSEGKIQWQHRAWQELTLGNNYSSFNIAQRYRLESIWSSHERKHELSNRLRYRLKVEHLLYKKWYLTFFNETFLQFEKPYFNQNRLHLGIGNALHPDLKIELGYFKNHFERAHFDRIRLGFYFTTHILERKEP